MNSVKANKTQGNGFMLVTPLKLGTFSKTVETRGGKGFSPVLDGTATGVIVGSWGAKAVIPASIVSWPRKQPYTSVLSGGAGVRYLPLIKSEPSGSP